MRLVRLVILIMASLLLTVILPQVALAGTCTVKPGDTLYNLAVANGITVQDIIADNKLNSNIIYPGQVLYLRDNPNAYTIQPGDTLWIVASQFGTTVGALRQANGIWNDMLYVGQKIIIPGQTARPSQASRVASAVDESDLSLLARIVYAEARGETVEGQVAVAAVILNRTRNSGFPNNVAGVVYQPGAFESLLDGQFNLTPDNRAYQAARQALAGWDPSNGALYFWNPNANITSTWIWTRTIVARIGNHVFGI